MQTSLTIKQILSLAAGSPVQSVTGTVRAVNFYQQGTADGESWYLQEIMLDDETGSIPASIINHPELPQNYDDDAHVLFFTAQQKAPGKTVGLRVQEEEDPQSKRKYKILAVGTAALISTQPPAEPATQPPAADVPPPVAPAPAPELPPVAAAPKAAGMRVSEVHYSQRVGSETIGVSVRLDPGTKALAALQAAKKFVHSNLPQDVAQA